MTIKKGKEPKIKIGDRFNKLTIIRELEPIIRYNKKNGWRQLIRRYECMCDCGNISIVQSNHLYSGVAKSCGCLKIKHRLSNHSLHGVWSDMKKRCYNSRHKWFYRYGGRGIAVCERWMIFKNFYDDVIEGYKKELKLERINNDGNYEPSNCKWDTQKNQANNTRRTIFVEYNNERLPLTIACEKLGLKVCTIRNRIDNLNMTFMEAIQHKKHSRANKLK